jgi:hypothetical protein
MALFGRLGDDVEPGDRKAETTRRREAYFLEYARTIREAARDVPLMVTGGFRTVRLMREVIDSGEVDVIGLARPFCVLPDLASQVLSGALDVLPAPEKQRRLGPSLLGPASPIRSIRTLNGQAEVAWFYRQIIALSEGREPDLALGTWGALGQHFATELSVARRRKFKRPRVALPSTAETEETRVDA